MKKKIKSAQEAKEFSSEIWHMIADLDLKSKYELPPRLYNKIKNLRAKCPLCEWFQFDTDKTYIGSDGEIKHIIGADCSKCPLGKADQECNDYLECNYIDHKYKQFVCIKCFDKRDYFTQWQHAHELFSGIELLEIMTKAANGIADIIDDWEI